MYSCSPRPRSPRRDAAPRVVVPLVRERRTLPAPTGLGLALTRRLYSQYAYTILLILLIYYCSIDIFTMHSIHIVLLTIFLYSRRNAPPRVVVPLVGQRRTLPAPVPRDHPPDADLGHVQTNLRHRWRFHLRSGGGPSFLPRPS